MAVEFSASTPIDETEDPTPIVPRCLTSADNADWGVSAAGGIGGSVSLSTPELSPTMNLDREQSQERGMSQGQE